MCWLRRLSLLALLGALLSCEAAQIAAPPPAEEALDGWDPSPDWPRLPADKKLGRVLGVTLDARGRVWISHTDDDGPPEILALDPESGEIVDSIDARGLRTAHALVFDDAGNLWVTDEGANRVVVFNPGGQIVRTIGGE